LAWAIEFAPGAVRELAKLDPADARRILAFLKERVAPDPRGPGSALHGPSLGEFWRYRVGDFRILCRIEGGRLRVLVVKVGQRRDVYR
jgi:mRNA interferase RelE/StbE